MTLVVLLIVNWSNHSLLILGDREDTLPLLAMIVLCSTQGASQEMQLYIPSAVLFYLMSHMGKGNKPRVGTNKLFPRHTVPDFQIFFHYINNGGAGDRALFCHLTSSPQTQQQQQAEMLPENRLQPVCNIHEENQNGCQRTPQFNYSAKPILWGEETSFVHVSELVTPAHCHLPDTCTGLSFERHLLIMLRPRRAIFF